MLLLLCLLHFQIQGTVRSKKVDALSFYNFAPFQIPSPDLFEHRIFFVRQVCFTPRFSNNSIEIFRQFRSRLRYVYILLKPS